MQSKHRVAVTGSRAFQPPFDAARILVGEGRDPNRKLEMRRAGAALLRAAAKLDVERARFVRHREIGRESAARASKVKSGTPAHLTDERTSEPVRCRRPADL
jgi:hypothetical protein